MPKVHEYIEKMKAVDLATSAARELHPERLTLRYGRSGDVFVASVSESLCARCVFDIRTADGEQFAISMHDADARRLARWLVDVYGIAEEKSNAEG